VQSPPWDETWANVQALSGTPPCSLEEIFADSAAAPDVCHTFPSDIEMRDVPMVELESGMRYMLSGQRFSTAILSPELYARWGRNFVPKKTWQATAVFFPEVGYVMTCLDSSETASTRRCHNSSSAADLFLRRCEMLDKEGKAGGELARLSKKETSRLALKALTELRSIGGIEQYNMLSVFYRRARDIAHQLKLHAELGSTMDAYIRLPELVPQDRAYYGVECGESHEYAMAQAQTEGNMDGVRQELIAAVQAYKIAAEACVAGDVSHGQKFHSFNCLGLALKRGGVWDMAERAYFWALSDNTIQDHRLVMANLTALMRDRGSVIRNQASTKDGLKKKREKEKHALKGRFKLEQLGVSYCYALECDVGSKAVPLKRCSKCETAEYCSRECQAQHWPDHKADCKKWRHQKQAFFNQKADEIGDEEADTADGAADEDKDSKSERAPRRGGNKRKNKKKR